MKYLLLLFIVVANVYAKDILLSYDFTEGGQGWKVQFADFPKGEEYSFELESELSSDGRLISGNNLSADLYMFMTKKIGVKEGIYPGKTYNVRFQVTFASNAPSDCIGPGGSPGESVLLMGNVVKEKPALMTDELNMIRTNFDHGSLISNIANGVPCEEDRGEYVTLIKTQEETIKVRSNRLGHLWLVIGTDSGFESTTALFYKKVEVFITQ